MWHTSLSAWSFILASTLCLVVRWVHTFQYKVCENRFHNSDKPVTNAFKTIHPKKVFTSNQDACDLSNGARCICRYYTISRIHNITTGDSFKFRSTYTMKNKSVKLMVRINELSGWFEAGLWRSERRSRTEGGTEAVAERISDDLSGTKRNGCDTQPQGHTSRKAHVTL